MNPYVFTIFLFILSGACSANDVMSQQQVAERINQLTEDTVGLPKDIIAELDQLTALSRKKQWHENAVHAQTLKAEFLVMLEQLPKATNVVNDTLPLAIENNFTRLISRLKLVKLGVLDSSAYTPEVEALIQELLTEAKHWNDDLEAASIYTSIGQSYYMHKMLDQSIIYLKKAYDIYQPLDDKANMSYVLNSLANLYSELGDFQKSIDYFEQSIAINKSLDDMLSVSIIYYNQGKTYTLAKQFDDAIKSLEASLNIATEIEDEIGIVWARQAIADVYIERGNPQEALVLYKKTAPVFQENGNPREYFHAVQGMFDAHFMLGEYDQCNALKPTIEALLDELNSDAYFVKFTKRFADLAAMQDDHVTAYTLLMKYTEQKAALDSAEKQKNIQQLKIGFDTEYQEHQNQLLQKENQLQQLKITQQQQERYLWLVIILLAIMLLIIVMFMLHRQIKSRNQYKTLALKDTLTDSPNRRAILKTAQIHLRHSLDTDRPFSLAIVDLDKFKRVNDVYGHDTGDEVLKAFSEACKSTVRKLDQFGRYGGEEWLFIFEEQDEEAITAIFQRIRSTLNAKVIPGYPPEKDITFSVGVARKSSSHNKKLQELINLADNQLYKAKDLGRDTIVFEESYKSLKSGY